MKKLIIIVMFLLVIGFIIADLSLAKFKSFWQIDFKYNDHGRGAIIQYDEKTKEFLFQLRYSNEGTVFKMLEQIAGDLNRI